MARRQGRPTLAFLIALAQAVWRTSAFRSSREQARASSALIEEVKSLDGAVAGAYDTPVTRVVNLLNAMQTALKKDMEDDEALHDKLSCWCQSSKAEKQAAASASTAKIDELGSSAEALSAKGVELKTSIKEFETGVASNKKALAEATAIREKEQKEAHGGEVDSVQAVENLKAAIQVLTKHQAAPESSVAGGAIFKTPEDQFDSLIALKSVTQSEQSWSMEHEASHVAQPLEEFMRKSGFEDEEAVAAAGSLAPPPVVDRGSAGFLQGGARTSAGAAERSSAMSPEDKAAVQRALRSAAAFTQARHGEAYHPAYSAQSGEILGVLKKLLEEMQGDLKEAQSRERSSTSAFEELRSAKTDEIQTGERMAESKEDDLATTENKLAEAKEDLKDEEAALSETQKFLTNLEATCADAETNFQERKAARLAEIQAVSDAAAFLTEDEARDAMTGTYSFLQQTSSSRQRAAAALRAAARRSRDTRLSLLASTVELDAFAKVKAAIDHMVSMLKVQQEDEVKKNDVCKAEIHNNEMDTEKQVSEKADLEATDEQLASDAKTMEAEIADAKAQVAQLQQDLQQASIDRQAENLAYQKTVQDQVTTVEALKKALARLEVFYKGEKAKAAALVESGFSAAKAVAAPVPQMKYTPSKAASGTMQLIDKLIQDAKAMMADARKSEVQAQAAYEQTVVDTHAAVAALQKEVTTKSRAKAKVVKEKLQSESDIADTMAELDGLAKYNSKLHVECDYILKNFESRQEARAEEIEALQQAQQILSGASSG